MKGTSMIKEKALPDHVYRLCAIIIVVLTILIIPPSGKELTDDIYTAAMLAAGVFLCVEVALFIKRYKHDVSILFELYQACMVPTTVYLYTRISPPDRTIKGLLIFALFSFLYIAIMFKINVINRNRRRNKAYKKKVLAFGLYNLRIALLVVMSIQFLWIAFFPSASINNVRQDEIKGRRSQFCEQIIDDRAFGREERWEVKTLL